MSSDQFLHLLFSIFAGNGVEILSCEAGRGVKSHSVQEHVSRCGILYLNLKKNVVLYKSCDSHMTSTNMAHSNYYLNIHKFCLHIQWLGHLKKRKKNFKKLQEMSINSLH